MIVRSPIEMGHLVRDFRLQKKLTQATLAGRVGVSRKWVIDFESGKRTADVSLVLRTLNVLGIELDARPRPTSRAKNGDIDINELIERTRRSKQ